MATGFAFTLNSQYVPSIPIGITGTSYTATGGTGATNAPTGGNWFVWTVNANTINPDGPYNGPTGTTVINGNVVITGSLLGVGGGVYGSSGGYGTATQILLTGTGTAAGPSVGTLGGSSDKIVFVNGNATTYPVSIGNTGSMLYQSVPTAGTIAGYIGGTGALSNNAAGVSIGYGSFFGTGATGSVVIGLTAGVTGPNSVAIGWGADAGATGSIAIGAAAGSVGLMTSLTGTTMPSSLGPNSISIGAFSCAGSTGMGPTSTTAIGYYAGYSNQATGAFAMGNSAGQYNQGVNAIAVGTATASLSQEGAYGISVGANAGVEVNLFSYGQTTTQTVVTNNIILQSFVATIPASSTTPSTTLAVPSTTTNTYYFTTNSSATTPVFTLVTVSSATSISAVILGANGTQAFVFPYTTGSAYATLNSGSTFTTIVGLPASFTAWSVAATATLSNMIVCTGSGTGLVGGVFWAYNASPITSPPLFSQLTSVNNAVFATAANYNQCAIASTAGAGIGVAVLTYNNNINLSQVLISVNATISTNNYPSVNGLTFTAPPVTSLQAFTRPTINYWNAAAVSGNGQYILVAAYGGEMYVCTNGTNAAGVSGMVFVEQSELGVNTWQWASMSTSGQYMAISTASAGGVNDSSGASAGSIFISYNYGNTWSELFLPASYIQAGGIEPGASGSGTVRPVVSANGTIFVTSSSATLYSFSLSINNPTNTVAIGAYAGNYNQGGNAVAFGFNAGGANQGTGAVAIGAMAGMSAQGTFGVAIGMNAGNNVQGQAAVAIGAAAGFSGQLANAVAIGPSAAGIQPNTQLRSLLGMTGPISTYVNNAAYTGFTGFFISTSGFLGVTGAQQGVNATAIGSSAGAYNQTTGAIAIGQNTGLLAQSVNSIAIGSNAGAQDAVGWVPTPSTLSISNLYGISMSGSGQYQLAVPNINTAPTYYYLCTNGNTLSPTWSVITLAGAASSCCIVSSSGQNMMLLGGSTTSYSTNYGQTFVNSTVTVTQCPWNTTALYGFAVSSSTLQYILVGQASTNSGIYLSINGQTSAYSFTKIDGFGGFPLLSAGYTLWYPGFPCTMSSSGNTAILCIYATNNSGSNIYYTNNIVSSNPNVGIYPTWIPLASLNNTNGLPSLVNTSITQIVWTTTAISGNGDYILIGAFVQNNSNNNSYVYLSTNGTSGTPTFSQVVGLPSLNWEVFKISVSGQYMYAVGVCSATQRTNQLYYSTSFGTNWTQLSMPSNANIYSSLCFLAMSQDAQYLLLTTVNGPIIYNGVVNNSIAIGTLAGSNNQGGNSVAIGTNAGAINAGGFSVAIGNNASAENDPLVYGATIGVSFGTALVSTPQGIGVSQNGQYILYGSQSTGATTLALSIDGGNSMINATSQPTGLTMATIVMSANAVFQLTIAYNPSTSGGGYFYTSNGTAGAAISFSLVPQNTSGGIAGTSYGGACGAMSSSGQYIIVGNAYPSTSSSVNYLYYSTNGGTILPSLPTFSLLGASNGIPTASVTNFWSKASMSSSGQYIIIPFSNSSNVSTNVATIHNVYYSTNGGALSAASTITFTALLNYPSNNLPQAPFNNGYYWFHGSAMSSSGQYILLIIGSSFNTSTVGGYAYLSTNGGPYSTPSTLVFNPISFQNMGSGYNFSCCSMSNSGQYMMISMYSNQNIIYVSYTYGQTWSTIQGVYQVSVAIVSAMSGDGTKMVFCNSTTFLNFFTLIANTTANTVSIGNSAGQYNQAYGSISIGYQAGQTFQGGIVSSTNAGSNAIAIGYQAGQSWQGANAIAIGYQAGQIGQPAGSFYISTSSIRPATFGQTLPQALCYWTATGEIFSNTTKTFIIDHPTDLERHLVHGCLEGPENGIYYRGIGTCGDVCTITLPDYVKCIGNNFTVHVTRIATCVADALLAPFIVSPVVDGSFTVTGPSGAFWWTVYGSRGDMEVQPLRSDGERVGDGPYTSLRMHPSSLETNEWQQ